MNLKSFVSLSVLVFLSAVAYGKLYPRDGIPQSDCLEMFCASGICMEDEKLDGFCCPVSTKLPKLGESCTECGCSVGICKLDPGKSTGGHCVECLTDKDCMGNLVCLPSNVCGCSEDSTLYTNLDNTKDCCVNATHVLADVDGSENKVCCPKETPKWDNTTKQCIKACEAIDLYSYKELAPHAKRDIGVHDVNGGVIGPYECDYKVIMPWWSVDDNVCIQGSTIACQEPDSWLKKWHTVGVGINTSDYPNNRFSLTNPEVAYILPAGKQIKLRLVNRVNAAGGGNNSSLSVSVRLEPITEGVVTEQCGNGWFTLVSSGSCSSLGCHNERTLKKKDTASGQQEKCCVDEGANKVVSTINGLVCCPIGRYQKMTYAEYLDGKKVSERVEETCCPEGEAATDSGCCKTSDVRMEGDTPKCPRNCPANTFWNLVVQRCTECLTYYGNGEGACQTTEKPLCNTSTWVCEPCPDGQTWNIEQKQCMGVCISSELPSYDQPCIMECGCLNPETTHLSCSATTNKCVCPEGEIWDAATQTCQKNDDITAELCWTSADMYCQSLFGMTFDGISMDDMFKQDCVKNKCYLGPNPIETQKPYLKARVKFEYLTPETEGVVKKISLGTNLNGASEIATLTQPNTWSSWKEIAMFERCTSAKNPKQVWLAMPYVKEAYNNACTQKGNNNYNNKSFNLKFCVQYKYFGHIENGCTAKKD